MNLKTNLELVINSTEHTDCSIDSICEKIELNQSRKQEGIFLTDSKLAKIVSKKIISNLKQGHSIIDPACGAGDLLIHCQQKAKELNIKNINSKLYGIDIHREFIELTKERLTSKTSINIGNQFIEGNALDNIGFIKKHRCIIMNPPYYNSTVNEKLAWANGKLQFAAYFFYKIISSLESGTRVIAILPDVLRSGTRYKKWRNEVNKYSKKLKVEVMGKFGEQADVDVFILDITIGKSNKKFFWQNIDDDNNKNCIEAHFNVHVGSVVPHRDPEAGKISPFISSKNTDCGSKIFSHKITEKRKYAGNLIKPPFVAIRRTSSPSDKKRIMWTLISGKTPVTVENHIIIIKPKDNTVNSCNKLIEKLEKKSTNIWINKHMRCRHLTVGLIKKIPY